MPLITHALLYVGYALIALTTGLALNNVGGASLSEAILSGLALFSAAAIAHGGIAAAYAAGALRRVEGRVKADVERLRVSQRETLADIDAVAARLDAIDRAIAETREYRMEAPQSVSAAPDLQMIDQIVGKLERAIEGRLDETRRIAAPNGSMGAGAGTMDLVRDALMENRVELHLQPIVSLPQRRTVFYESFTRLKDASGRMILPQEFIPVAEKAGLMSQIDNLLLFRCVQIVRKLLKNDRRVGIFCNLASHALADDAFFPQFLDFMRGNSDLAGSLLFELPQAAFEARSAMEARAMAKLADLGFRFSIDKVTHLDIDLPDLERAGVRYFKVSSAILMEQMVRDGVRPKSAITREIASADVAAVFQRYGVDLIAERIETEQQVLDVLDLDTPYAQGHLFGAPRAIKESLMEETAPPREFFQRNGRVA